MNRKEEQWRNEGAAYALRIAKEKGVEGLETDFALQRHLWNICCSPRSTS